MKDGYPEEHELQEIEKWDVVKNGYIPLIEYIRERWQYADCGYFHMYKKKGKIHLRLSTAGWSGNESIVEALKKNWVFWILYWQKSVKGGHFWFEIADRMQEKGK